MNTWLSEYCVSRKLSVDSVIHVCLSNSNVFDSSDNKGSAWSIRTKLEAIQIKWTNELTIVILQINYGSGDSQRITNGWVWTQVRKGDSIRSGEHDCCGSSVRNGSCRVVDNGTEVVCNGHTGGCGDHSRIADSTRGSSSATGCWSNLDRRRAIGVCSDDKVVASASVRRGLIITNSRFLSFLRFLGFLGTVGWFLLLLGLLL